ncbi:MAG: hypothetical protein WDK96_02440 [Candidatus Paceibacterota bacterium]
MAIKKSQILRYRLSPESQVIFNKLEKIIDKELQERFEENHAISVNFHKFVKDDIKNILKTIYEEAGFRIKIRLLVYKNKKKTNFIELS